MSREVMNQQRATLHVVATLADEHLLVGLRGELDVACTEVVDDVNDLDLTGVTTLMVDLTELEFCDSTGIAAFLRLSKHQGAAGRSVQFTNPSPLLRRTFEVLGIDHLLVP